MLQSEMAWTWRLDEIHIQQCWASVCAVHDASKEILKQNKYSCEQNSKIAWKAAENINDESSEEAISTTRKNKSRKWTGLMQKSISTYRSSGGEKGCLGGRCILIWIGRIGICWDLLRAFGHTVSCNITLGYKSVTYSPVVIGINQRPKSAWEVKTFGEEKQHL